MGYYFLTANILIVRTFLITATPFWSYRVLFFNSGLTLVMLQDANFILVDEKISFTQSLEILIPVAHICRYTLNIDPHRHEDVLLHMELLMEAREAEYATSCSRYGHSEPPTPQVHVRKVQLAGFGSSGDAPSPASSPRGGALRKDGLQIPKPAFGSGSNLVGLGLGGSPKLHIEPGLGRSFSTPRLSPYGGSPLNCNSTNHSIPRPLFGNFINPLHIDDDVSEHEDASSHFGYEVTIATTDRQGLLKYFTSALSDSHLQLNIKVH